MNRLYKAILGIIFFAVAIISWLLYPAHGVPILAYHMVNSQPETYSIDPEEFERHMRYLAEHGYTAISLQEFFQAMDYNEALPEKPVIITFDDGYLDNYQTALPIMEKYGMKGTVFVIAGDVGKPGYLSWDRIKEMRQRKTEIGSHTTTHAKLKDLSYDDQFKETAEAKKLLEGQLQRPVEFMAYPYGGYNDSVVKAIQAAGYLGACTGKAGLNNRSTDHYALRRINIPRPRCGLWEFRLRLLRADIWAKIGK